VEQRQRRIRGLGRLFFRRLFLFLLFLRCLGLARHPSLLETPRRGGRRSQTIPTLCGGNRTSVRRRRPLPAPLATRPTRARGLSSGPLKPRLSLHRNRKPKA